MKKTQKKAIIAGASLAAVAAAAAGVYFLTGKNAKNRKKLAKWAEDMKNDVVKELNKAGKHSKASYQQIVDSVAKNYKGLKNVSAPELSQMASELKSHWDIISAEVSQAGKAVKRAIPSTKKVVKKAKKSVTKKTVSKTVKKAVKKTRI